MSSAKKTQTNHSFSKNVASVLMHIQKAILLKDLKRFCEYKIKIGKDIGCKMGWVYMSAAAMKEAYPYMNPKSIARWMKEMEQAGLIISTAKFNKKGYDRTKWYTVNLESYENLSNGAEINISQTKKWISQTKKWISQNEELISQNEELISQNEEPIPPLTTPLTTPQEKERNLSETKIEKEPQWVLCQAHIIGQLKGTYSGLLRGARQRSKYRGRMSGIIEDYCRNIAEGKIEGKGGFHLIPPKDEGEHYKWLGRMMAGIERYMKAGVRRNDDSQIKLKAIPKPTAPPVPFIRATAAQARKIAGIA